MATTRFSPFRGRIALLNTANRPQCSISTRLMPAWGPGCVKTQKLRSGENDFSYRHRNSLRLRIFLGRGTIWKNICSIPIARSRVLHSLDHNPKAAFLGLMSAGRLQTYAAEHRRKPDL